MDQGAVRDQALTAKVTMIAFVIPSIIQAPSRESHRDRQDGCE